MPIRDEEKLELFLSKRKGEVDGYIYTHILYIYTIKKKEKNHFHMPDKFT